MGAEAAEVAASASAFGFVVHCDLRRGVGSLADFLSFPFIHFHLYIFFFLPISSTLPPFLRFFQHYVLTRPITPKTHDTEQKPDAELVDDQDVDDADVPCLQGKREHGGKQREQEDRVGLQTTNDFRG